MSTSLPVSPRRLLIVDDEPAMRDTLALLFRRAQFDVTTASGCKSAIELVKTVPEPFPVVLTDLRMPDGDGFLVLEAARERSAATEVIVMTAYHEHAYDAMRRGAYDFVSKPFPSLREVAERVEKAHEKATIVAENQALRAQVKASRLRPWIARGQAMRKILDIVDKVAATRTTVLITGESGTGKDRIARLIHDKSDRASRPFVAVNCGALPENLMESELFGHERGAFTGASSRTTGMLREADSGTIFLDEICELPMSLQVKLLRVLQERKIRAVGGSAETDVDVRVLAATNRDIEELVAQGTFRRDLYYRLNVIRIAMPALHERRDELAMLIEAFIRRFAAEHGKNVRGITPEAFRVLNDYSFPGNVRELENIIERSVALTDGRTIGLDALPDEAISGTNRPAVQLELPQDGCDLDAILESVERKLIFQALERSGSVRKTAAGILGVTFRSLRYRLAKLGIEPLTPGDDVPESGEDSSVPPTPGKQGGPSLSRLSRP